MARRARFSADETQDGQQVMARHKSGDRFAGTIQKNGGNTKLQKHGGGSIGISDKDKKNWSFFNL